MNKIVRSAPALAVLTLAALAVTAHERPAAACGGCFHGSQGPEVDSVVTDHRMVFALSKTETVLWDQIRYSGDPRRFAWVLPVQPGARVELSHDAFLAALDASTQTVITGPSRTCANGSTQTYGGGGSGCGASSSSFASADVTPTAGAEDAGFAGNDQVTVVSQDVVGPYETVTVRSSNGEALDAWLVANGFAVPPAIQPTIDAYANEGFDFIALKLEPTAGIRAMVPVRVVTKGADPSLPLRMVAAGIGTHVGLTLYVISEGRYHPQNFPDVSVPLDQLTWDPKAARSNYQDLAMAALQSGDGRGWLTEFAGATSLDRSPFVLPSTGTNNPGLADAYYGLCATMPPIQVPVSCTTKAPPRGPSDGGASDAAPDDGGDAGDAEIADAAPDDAAADAAPGADASPPPDAGCFASQPACDTFDDLDVALTGMNKSDVRVTRLRAFLPAGALAAGDLRLEATPVQSAVSSLHHTDRFRDPTFDPCANAGGSATPSTSSSGGVGCLCATAPSEGKGPGHALLFAGAGLLAIMLARRGRRDRAAP
jgi:Uncharacterized protein conserved in bacteria (DUF2330)